MSELPPTLPGLAEAGAVALGVAYLLLAAREKILCWPAAFLSTALSVYVFWNVDLLMESFLNLYYMGMAVYGWRQWRRGGGPGGKAPVRRWSAAAHVLAIGAILTAAILSGRILATSTEAARPYLDSFTTWASVLTTFMVARKILENWIYWFVIDGVSIFLYLDRGLYLYAALFAFYLVICVAGFLSWRRSLLAAGQQGRLAAQTAAAPLPNHRIPCATGPKPRASVTSWRLMGALWLTKRTPKLRSQAGAGWRTL